MLETMCKGYRYQENLKLCQGIVREMSGNIASAREWRPFLGGPFKYSIDSTVLAI